MSNTHFDCLLCHERYPYSDKVIFRNCTHYLCMPCMRNFIDYGFDYKLRCPFCRSYIFIEEWTPEELFITRLISRRSNLQTSYLGNSHHVVCLNGACIYGNDSMTWCTCVDRIRFVYWQKTGEFFLYA